MPLKVYRNVHNVYIIDQKTFKEVLMARNTTTAKVKKLGIAIIYVMQWGKQM